MSSRRVPKNRAFKKLLGVRLTGTKKYCLGKCSTWMVRDARWGRVLDRRQKTSPGTGVKKFTWTVTEIFHLDGRRKTLFGRSSKYFVWTVIEVLCLDGQKNSSFGRSSKFFVWTVVKICLLDRRPKFGLWNSFWMGVEKFLLGGPDKLMDNARGGHAIGWWWAIDW